MRGVPFAISLARMLFYPFPCIDESLYPWSHFVEATVTRIPCILPREDSTLEVWHHCEMTTVFRADTSHVVVAAVRIGWITMIVVFSDDVILVCCLWQRELALSVSHPDAELVPAQ